jgi:hypothetical protein
MQALPVQKLTHPAMCRKARGRPEKSSNARELFQNLVCVFDARLAALHAILAAAPFRHRCTW